MSEDQEQAKENDHDEDGHQPPLLADSHECPEIREDRQLTHNPIVLHYLPIPHHRFRKKPKEPYLQSREEHQHAGIGYILVCVKRVADRAETKEHQEDAWPHEEFKRAEVRDDADD